MFEGPIFETLNPSPLFQVVWEGFNCNERVHQTFIFYSSYCRASSEVVILSFVSLRNTRRPGVEGVGSTRVLGGPQESTGLFGLDG